MIIYIENQVIGVTWVSCVMTGVSCAMAQLAPFSWHNLPHMAILNKIHHQNFFTIIEYYFMLINQSQQHTL